MRAAVLALALALSACTVADVTLSDGTRVNITTFATSRQNINIGRSPTGEVYWRADDSSPDQTLANAVLQLTALISKTPTP